MDMAKGSDVCFLYAACPEYAEINIQTKRILFIL